MIIACRKFSFPSDLWWGSWRTWNATVVVVARHRRFSFLLERLRHGILSVPMCAKKSVAQVGVDSFDRRCTRGISVYILVTFWQRPNKLDRLSIDVSKRSKVFHSLLNEFSVSRVISCHENLLAKIATSLRIKAGSWSERVFES